MRYAANVWTGDTFETGGEDVVFWERKLPINNQEFKAIFVTVAGTARTENGERRAPLDPRDAHASANKSSAGFRKGRRSRRSRPTPG